MGLETADVDLSRQQQNGSFHTNGRSQIDDLSAKTQDVNLSMRTLDPPSVPVSRTNSDDNLLKFSPKGADASPSSITGVQMV